MLVCTTSTEQQQAADTAIGAQNETRNSAGGSAMVLTHSRGQSPEPPGATTPSTSETCLGTKPLRENAALLIWDLMVGRGLCPRAAEGSVPPRGGAV